MWSSKRSSTWTSSKDWKQTINSDILMHLNVHDAIFQVRMRPERSAPNGYIPMISFELAVYMVWLNISERWQANGQFRYPAPFKKTRCYIWSPDENRPKRTKWECLFICALPSSINAEDDGGAIIVSHFDVIIPNALTTMLPQLQFKPLMRCIPGAVI